MRILSAAANQLLAYVPRPLRHVGLALVSGVEAFLAAPGSARGRQDPHGLGVFRYKAAYVVSMNAAIGVHAAPGQGTRPVLHAIAAVRVDLMVWNGIIVGIGVVVSVAMLLTLRAVYDKKDVKVGDEQKGT